MSSPKLIDKKNIIKTGQKIVDSIEKNLKQINDEDDSENEKKSPKQDRKKEPTDDAKKSSPQNKKKTAKKSDDDDEEEEEEEVEKEEKVDKKKKKPVKKNSDDEDEEEEEEVEVKDVKKGKKTTKKAKVESEAEKDEDEKEIEYNETTILDSRINASEFDASLVRHGDTTDFIDNLLEMSPKKGDFDYKENKKHRETFITDQRKGVVLPDESREEPRPDPWKIYDILIPAGKPAKLVRIFDAQSEDLRVSQIVDKLKFIDPKPVILLAGAMTERAGKLLAGVARAAYRTDAVVIDSGVGNGIEPFCIRKDIPLIGVAPESEIAFPKLNPTERPANELSNGHTHFFILGDKTKKYKWEEEAVIKIELAERIAMGRSKYGPKSHCKVITVILGDNQSCSEEILLSHKRKWPIIMVEGSEMVAEFTKYKKKEVNYLKNNKLRDFVRTGKYYTVKDNSEDIASLLHLLIAVNFDY